MSSLLNSYSTLDFKLELLSSQLYEPLLTMSVAAQPQKSPENTRVRDASSPVRAFRVPAVLVFRKRGAVAAAAVATVKPLGPGRGTTQPEFRAQRADRPKRI